MNENKDYTYLKDKDFVVKTLKKDFQGFLAEIEPAIGITVLNKQDHALYLYCLRGPSANVDLFKRHPEVARIYEEMFDLVVEGIEQGKLLLSKVVTPEKNASYLRRRKASAETCPFT